MLTESACIPSRRVLLVDDIELNRVLTEAVLRGATYEVDSVEDGPAAFAALARKTYDLVLMDLELPGLDGHTAAEVIKRDKRDQVKIAALSANAGAADRAKSQAIGMSAHIARPITPRDLLREIERVFCQPAHQTWDQTPYREWVSRLGAGRMRGVLVKLLDEMRAFDGLIEAADPDIDAVHHRAHDIASTAGMLGFVEVMGCCRCVQEKAGQALDHDALTSLGDALQRAVMQIDDYLDTIEPEAKAA